MTGLLTYNHVGERYYITFALCRRKSANPSQIRLSSVTLVHPTESVEQWRRKKFLSAGAHLVENLVFDRVFNQVFDKFMRVYDTFSTSFRLFCRKPGREPAASIWTSGVARIWR